MAFLLLHNYTDFILRRLKYVKFAIYIKSVSLKFKFHIILQGAIIMETQDIIYKKFGACVCKSLTTLPSA